MSYQPIKQYTEGDVDATITGTASMWEDVGNVLRPASALTRFPVDSVNAFESLVNSTTTPLGAAGVFTGTFENVSNYSTLQVFVSVLPLNAGTPTNKAVLEWSYDGITVDFADNWTVTAETSSSVQGQTYRCYEFPIRSHFVRISYTNSSVVQTSFRLSLVYRRQAKNVSLVHNFQQRSTLDPSTLKPIFSGTWEPLVANGQSVLINTSAATATRSSGIFRNSGIRGMTFNLNVSAVPVAPGTGGLDLKIVQLDGSSNESEINVNAAMGTLVRATGLYRWVIGLGASGTNLGPNIRQTLAVPPPVLYRAKVVHYDAQSYTYNVQVDFGQ